MTENKKQIDCEIELKRLEAELESSKKLTFLDGFGEYLSSPMNGFGRPVDRSDSKKRFLNYKNNPKSWIGFLIVAVFICLVRLFFYFLSRN